MPRFELKQLAEYFWKGSPTPEEKTPIVKNSPRVPDSGSIKKGSSMGESKSTYSGLLDSMEGEAPPKMTLLRKLCFLLSLHGGVLYVAALLWWIPCRHPLCLAMQNWTVNISGQLTTNMEIKSTQLSSSLLFGMADEKGGKLSSLAMADGMAGWNRSTDNIFKNVFCDLHSSSDGLENVPDCIVTAYNYIGAFNSTNGSLLWERTLTDESGVNIRKVVLAGKPSTGLFAVALSDDEMFLLSAGNGTLLSTLDLPCSWTVDLKLLGPRSTGNDSSWTLVCEFGDSFEVWTFLEERVLGLPEEYDEEPFHLLFSRGSGDEGGSIDLSGDVTSTPHHLALSWADGVVMVTEQAPRKTWERRFGDNSAVTSVVSGSFLKPKENQIAVTVQDGSNTTLHILECKNGTSEVVTSLGMRSVMTMRRIASGDRGVDTLVIESISPGEQKQKSSKSHPTATRREYFTVKYSKQKPTFENIVTADAYASTFHQFGEGAADLLIASQSPDSSTLISRYVLITRIEDQCYF